MVRSERFETDTDKSARKQSKRRTWPTDGRGDHEEKGRKRSQPRSALFQRVDCGRRCLRLAGDCHQLAAGSGDSRARAPLAYDCSAAAVADRSFCFWPKDFRLACDQQPLRLNHVPDSCSISFLFRPQETGLKKSYGTQKFRSPSPLLLPLLFYGMCPFTVEFVIVFFVW